MCDPAAVQAFVAAWLGVALVLVAAVGAIVLQMLRNMRAIREAWRLLREHDAKIRNGHT